MEACYTCKVCDEWRDEDGYPIIVLYHATAYEDHNADEWKIRVSEHRYSRREFAYGVYYVEQDFDYMPNYIQGDMDRCEQGLFLSKREALIAAKAETLAGRQRNRKDIENSRREINALERDISSLQEQNITLSAVIALCDREIEACQEPQPVIDSEKT